MTGEPLGDLLDEEDQLADLRWHGDTAYEIIHSGGTWTARFLTRNGILLGWLS